MKQKIGGIKLEDKLLEIAKLMDNFSKEYGCRIEVETWAGQTIKDREIKYIYNLKAVKPQTVLEVIS